MGSDGRKPGEGEEQAFGPDTIERVIRDRVRATIETIVREELDAALGAARSARIGAQRCGYRHGTRPRTLTTSLGPTTIAMPRARVRGTDAYRTALPAVAAGRAAVVARLRALATRLERLPLDAAADVLVLVEPALQSFERHATFAPSNARPPVRPDLGRVTRGTVPPTGARTGTRGESDRRAPRHSRGQSGRGSTDAHRTAHTGRACS